MGKLQKPSIRKRVRLYLAEHEINQEQFADLCGMDGTKLSKILAGKAVPTIPQLAELEKRVGLTARDFAEVA